VVDAAFRVARVGDTNAAEVRFGFTWSIPVWLPAENAGGRQAAVRPMQTQL
jgi:hypothetical protein